MTNPSNAKFPLAEFRIDGSVFFAKPFGKHRGDDDLGEEVPLVPATAKFHVHMQVRLFALSDFFLDKLPKHVSGIVRDRRRKAKPAEGGAQEAREFAENSKPCCGLGNSGSFRALARMAPIEFRLPLQRAAVGAAPAHALAGWKKSHSPASFR